MKVHYINILFFALPLNILAHNKNKPHTTPRHTQPNRSLCECELYAPANYDNDPQMKEIIDNFNKQTQQRFHEYDDRMVEKRKRCKDKCDKEIQKIILKDKLEKQMAEELTTLETKIDTNDIPTCVCEKSMADKMAKGCFRCGVNVGGIVAPCSGVLTGIAEGALIVWKMGAPAAAIAAAEKAGALAGKVAGEAVGKKAVIDALTYYKVHNLFPGIFKSIGNIKHYTEVTNFSSQIVAKYKQICEGGGNIGADWTEFENGVSIHIEADNGSIITQAAEKAVPEFMNSVVRTAEAPAKAEAAKVAATKTAEFKETYMGAVDTAYASCQTAIIASVIAIVVIILIMVIIYKILRYRRKKKMKKKLQYIKLLEE
ncbi:rifin [Plasmodium reichenowi]|uniref:Rifin n=1 Tax=Plasmodium reichenowi TaxID=5854 RepID=A0A060RM04_PLARE|nr:rifin [Plasmodium reichenowi]